MIKTRMDGYGFKLEVFHQCWRCANFKGNGGCRAIEHESGAKIEELPDKCSVYEYLASGEKEKCEYMKVNGDNDWVSGCVCCCDEFKPWTLNQQREFYAEYMQYAGWRRRRNEKIVRAGYKCEVCGSAQNLCVHHITYESLGREWDEDLLVVCKECHKKIHENDILKKRQKREAAG